MATFALETFNLRKVFKSPFGKRIIAVEDLSLHVPVGSVFGFLGPNGAGKTTTIQMALGNVYPTRGTASVLGGSIHDLEIRRRIGFLPEKFQFHDFLTAEEFLSLHGSLSRMPVAEKSRRIEEVLDIVGLLDRRKSKIREFSKGMQQRIGLAQAILHNPDLVVLDEPTSALDPLGRRQVREVVQHLKEQNKTVFLNSHLLSEIELTCDSVAIINQGVVVKQGTIDDLLSNKSIVTAEIANLNDSVLEAIRRVSPMAQAQATATDQPGTVTSYPRVVATLDSQDAIPLLAEAVVSAGGKLMSLQYQRETLEDFFIRTVAGDTGEANN